MNKATVHVITDDLLFHPYDMDCISKTRALDFPKLNDSIDDDVYLEEKHSVLIKTQMNFLF